jgi:small neutral amino acid transporter SnatA (MarC family)
MTNIRQLVKIALTAVAATLLSLVPASGAWAMVPVPDPQTAGSGTAGVTTVVRTAQGTGFGDWQVMTIGAICALVAVVATLLATRLVQSHTHHSRLAHG